MKECSKSLVRRLSNSNFLRRYFVGDGIDIGGKPDPLALYAEFFPLVRSIRTWDWEDGDAQHLASVPDQSLDFVHSSHCLEHLVDPAQGLRNWVRVVKPGGHVVVTVPDEDLYEQGVFPSTFNRDHKWTFTMLKPASWSDKSINVIDLLRDLGGEVAIEKIELLDTTFRGSLPRFDQTLTPVGECGIEFVLRRRLEGEIADRGRLPGAGQPSAETRLHLNQYRDDLQTLKSSNATRPPFTNDEPI
ncbi:MAG TPA: methyltransferase domain-containing protein [Caulobacteraceae bacterium]|jgi:SAM-dependent methyltransferase